MLPPVNIPPNSGIRDWEYIMRQMGAIAEQCYDMCQRADRIYTANGLASLIETGKPNQRGKYIGDSSLTYEGAKSAKAFCDSFRTWMTTQLSVPMNPPAGMLLEDGQAVPAPLVPYPPLAVTPLQIVSARAGVPLPIVLPVGAAADPGATDPAASTLGPPIVPPDTPQEVTP